MDDKHAWDSQVGPARYRVLSLHWGLYHPNSVRTATSDSLPLTFAAPRKMAATPLMTPRARAAAAPPQPLLSVGEGASRAATAVAVELEKVLATHADDATTLSTCAARDPSRGAPHAESTVLTILETVRHLEMRLLVFSKLQTRGNAFLDASKRRELQPDGTEPACPESLSAAAIADEALTCLDSKLDALEARLAVLYDLPKVVVPTTTVAGTTTLDKPYMTSARHASEFEEAVAPSPAPHAGVAPSGTPFRSAQLPALRNNVGRSTPLQQATRLSPPTPSTPNMHDFGIDDAALEGLSAPILYHLGSAKKPLPKDAPYEEVVQRSMDALHIAQPQKTYSLGKHALGEAPTTPPLPPTPPNVDLPPLFPISESKPLPASSAPATPPRPKNPSRALTFDTPDTAAVPERRLTRSQSRKTAAQDLRSEVRAKVAKQIHSESGFFARKFDESAIFAAIDLLHSAHEKQGTLLPLTMSSEDLSELLQSLPVVNGPQDAMMLLYTLNKLGVTQLEVTKNSSGTSSYTFGKRA